MEQSCALCSRSLLAGVTILVSGIVPVPCLTAQPWWRGRGEGSGGQAEERGVETKLQSVDPDLLIGIPQEML